MAEREGRADERQAIDWTGLDAQLQKLQEEALEEIAQNVVEENEEGGEEEGEVAGKLAALLKQLETKGSEEEEEEEEEEGEEAVPTMPVLSQQELLQAFEQWLGKERLEELDEVTKNIAFTAFVAYQEAQLLKHQNWQLQQALENARAETEALLAIVDVMDRYGLNEDDLNEVVKLMEEKDIDDLETAAELYLLRKQAGTTGKKAKSVSAANLLPPASAEGRKRATPSVEQAPTVPPGTIMPTSHYLPSLSPPKNDFSMEEAFKEAVRLLKGKEILA